MNALNVKTQTLIDAQDLGRVNDLLGDSLNRLSSGSRLIDPAENPADVGTIAKFEAQQKRAQAASVNVQNAGSFVQCTAGFMRSMSTLVTRMSELTQLAADPLKSAGDLSLYQIEFQQLQEQLRLTVGGSTGEIGGTADVSNPLGTYNGVVLFGPNASGISIASGSHAGDNIVIPQTNLRSGSMLSLIQQDASGNFTLSLSSAGVSPTVSDALSQLANQCAVLDGVSTRLNSAADSLATENANLSQAISRINDTDVAAESTRLAKMHILLESGTAILAQANQSPKSVLKLLGSS